MITLGSVASGQVVGSHQREDPCCERWAPPPDFQRSPKSTDNFVRKPGNGCFFFSLLGSAPSWPYIKQVLGQRWPSWDLGSPGAPPPLPRRPVQAVIKAALPMDC